MGGGVAMQGKVTVCKFELSLRPPRSSCSFFVAIIECLVSYNYDILNVIFYKHWFRYRSTNGLLGGSSGASFNNAVNGSQLRAAIMWFAAQTYHMLALLRLAGVQGVKWCHVV